MWLILIFELHVIVFDFLFLCEIDTSIFFSLHVIDLIFELHMIVFYFLFFFKFCMWLTLIFIFNFAWNWYFDFFISMRLTLIYFLICDLHFYH